MNLVEDRQFFEQERFGRGPETPFDERFPCTDAGNGELLAHLHREHLRYDHRRGRWLEWAGQWWREDIVEAVVQLAKQAARYRYHQADSIADLGIRQAVAEWAIQSEQRARIEACLRLARSEWPLADAGVGWDADPWLLGVENGVLDLRKGERRPGRHEDYITKHAPVSFDPQANCPQFLSFLERVQPDPEMRAYLQRRAGYALTGVVSEQDLVLHHGAGANGKTTFANALMDALGRDHAKQAAPHLLLRSYGDRHPTEIADLDGVRLLVSTEVDEGRALAEELVKQLTGGDRIKARRMREDFFEFEATFKIMLLANHKPEVRGTDHGMWRRIKLVPWDVTIAQEERDPHLRSKLAAEASGILTWMLAGCLDWQRNGMREPGAVTSATLNYRVESDPLAEYLQACCVMGDTHSVQSADAYRAYMEWAREQGLTERQAMTASLFGRRMGARFQGGRNKRGKVYAGVGLLSERPAVTGLRRPEAPAVERVADPVTGSTDGFESTVTGMGRVPVDRNSLSSRSACTENAVNPSPPVIDEEPRDLGGRCEVCGDAASEVLNRATDASPVCDHHAGRHGFGRQPDCRHCAAAGPKELRI